MNPAFEASAYGLLLPSSVEAHVIHFEGIAIPLHIKRDDLIHPLISGNKWRKLQYFLAQAKAAQKTTLMSVGGAYSNHLLAIAALAKGAGRPSIGYIRGDESRQTNHYERWLAQLGMQLHYVDRTLYRDKEALYSQIAAQHAQAYLVPEGGNPLPDHQYVATLLDEQAMHYQHVVVSCGTGSMMIALAKGMAARGMTAQLHGVSAVHHPAFISQLNAICQQHYHYAKAIGKPTQTRFGKLTPDLLAIGKACFKQTGIAPDPVYDSGLLLYLLQCRREDSIRASEQVLWIHSGGALGWAGWPLKSHELFGL